jgi:ribonuclease D
MVSSEDAQKAYKAYKAHKVPNFSPTSPGAAYTFVDAADKLEPLIEALQRTTIVGLDLETTGLQWWQDRIRIVSITTEAGATFVIDAFKVAITPLFPALKGTKIVAHNALFDLLFLKRAGFEPSGCACTMVLSQILWAGKLKPGTNKNVEHDLASVAKRALNVTLDKSHQKEDWARELTPEMLTYAARDSVFLPKLYKELTHRIVQAG